MRLPEELLDSVDAWGVANSVKRSEAIRRLLELGLAAKSAITNPRRPTKRKDASHGERRI
jgi:metal-responsive CopG/Arc/MetJ family transcriptional regulator